MHCRGQRQLREASTQGTQGLKLCQPSAAQFGMDQIDFAPVRFGHAPFCGTWIVADTQQRCTDLQAEAFERMPQVTGIIGDAVLLGGSGASRAMRISLGSRSV